MTQEDVPGIVIEPGSAWTRVGIASDAGPRIVARTAVAREDGKITGFDRYLERYTGPNTEIHTPVIDGVIHDADAVAATWKYFVHEKLGMDLSEQPLTVTEEVWNPSVARKKILETVFEELDVPLFQLVSSPVCAALQTAHATALVVQVGASTTSAVPVVDGSPILKAAVHTRFAGDFVTAHALAQLSHLSVDVVPAYRVSSKKKPLLNLPATESFTSYQVSRVMDQFKQIGCVANPTPLTGPEIRGVRSFEFPDGNSVLVGPERLLVVEPLFKPAATPLPGSNLPGNSLGLSESIYHAYQKAEAPPEIGIHLASNIVLIGGTTQTPGLQQRIERDLQEMLPNYQPRFTELSSHDRVNAVWTGASVLASLGSYDANSWITKSQYEEIGAQQLVDKRFK